MDTRKVAMEYRLTQWSQALREKAATGISVKEFCLNKGVSKNTYFYWQKKLRNAACHILLPEAEKRRNEQGEHRPVFAALRAPRASGGAVTVRIGHNVAEIQDGTDAGTIESVLRALSRL